METFMRASVPSTVRLRPAGPSDFPAVAALETACFEPERRSAPRNLKHSLRSPAQRVILAEDGEGAAGALVCLLYPKRLRIYSVCTHPRAGGRGLGRALIEAGEALARKLGKREVSLEAAEKDPRLVNWYKAQGYAPLRTLPDYYAPGIHALRLVKILTTPVAEIG